MAENRALKKSVQPVAGLTLALSGQVERVIINGILAIGILAIGILAGCTAITDFDESRIKINLNKILFEESITFQTVDDVGYITLPFGNPLTPDECDSFDALVGEKLIFTVAKGGNTVGHDITKIRVDDVPGAPGEYAFGVGREGKRAVMSFYNRSESSTQPLVAPNDMVTLLIHVDDNPLITPLTYEFNLLVQGHHASSDTD
ncbi:MAG: hypothetical protein JXX14_03275 [Deltaproteobacteria bacterium]|nr:hypothetical protein [Deltaproteobacteria bacterium]